MHMDKELQELAFALMDKAAEKNLAKIAIQNGDFSITIETHAPAVQTVAVAAPAPQAAAQPAAAEEPETYEGTVVSAPLVGTFYAANAPDQPPLVSVGDTVTRGQTLCIIEAMKTMNSIESPCDGKISRILMQDGELVEFHQPLIVIE